MHLKLSILATLSLALAVSAAKEPKKIAAAAVVTSGVASSAAPVSSAPASGAPASSAPAAVPSGAIVLPPTGTIPAGPVQTIAAAAMPPCPGGCTWPPLDKPPPLDPAWANLVDLSKVPNAPVIGSTIPGSSAGDPINPGYTAANDPWCTWQFTQCARPSDILTCPLGSWGLTYDDGPSPFSPFLDAALAQSQQKATRFVIGSRALEYPQALKAMCDAGHHVAIHTYSHPYLTTMNTTTVIAELKWTERVIKAICGLTPKYFRPPHGDVDDRIRNIAEQLGYRTAIWNKDSQDWQVPAAPGPNDFQPSWVDGNITQWVSQIGSQTTGIVSLEHELTQAEAGESVISYPIIKSSGWKILNLADCLSDPVWYVEWANKTSNATTTGGPGSNSTLSPSGGGSNTTSSKPSDAGRLTAGITVATVGVIGMLMTLAL